MGMVVDATWNDTTVGGVSSLSAHSAADDTHWTVPLAAILCVVIVAYALLIVVCILGRHLLLNHAQSDRPQCWSQCGQCCPLCGESPNYCDVTSCVAAAGCCCHDNQASLTCCCRLPWRSDNKSTSTSLFERLSRKFHRGGGGVCCEMGVCGACCAPCPSSVRCCGLEIRRAAGPSSPLPYVSADTSRHVLVPLDRGGAITGTVPSALEKQVILNDRVPSLSISRAVQQQGVKASDVAGMSDTVQPLWSMTDSVLPLTLTGKCVVRRMSR